MKRQLVINRVGWRRVAAVLVVGYVCNISHAKGQVLVKPNDTIKSSPTGPQQEDAMDILKKAFKIKVNHKQEDSAKLKPGIIYPAVFPAVGYTIVNGPIATIGINLSFYTDSIKYTDLSTVVADPLISLLHQFVFPVISSIWSKDNQWNFLGDWRYYQYPSYTYGLGAETSLNNADLIDYSYVKVYQEALYHLGHNMYAGLGYNLDYHYDISDVDNNSDYNKYANDSTVKKTVSSGLVVHFKYDDRTNTNNPRDALFASIEYRYNTNLLGSDNNWQELQLDVRKYINIGKNNVLAFWNWDEFTFGGTTPYLDLPSTGWDTYANSGRGFIQGRYRGTSLVYGEGEFRFGILKSGLLGGVVFVNGESVPEWPSNKFEAIDMGEGVGLRIKLNRFSDTNFCIDYGFGTGGSRGFFFNLGEVF